MQGSSAVFSEEEFKAFQKSLGDDRFSTCDEIKALYQGHGRDGVESCCSRNGHDTVAIDRFALYHDETNAGTSYNANDRRMSMDVHRARRLGLWSSIKSKAKFLFGKAKKLAVDKGKDLAAKYCTPENALKLAGTIRDKMGGQAGGPGDSASQGVFGKLANHGFNALSNQLSTHDPKENLLGGLSLYQNLGGSRRRLAHENDRTSTNIAKQVVGGAVGKDKWHPDVFTNLDEYKENGELHGFIMSNEDDSHQKLLEALDASALPETKEARAYWMRFCPKEIFHEHGHLPAAQCLLNKRLVTDWTICFLEAKYGIHPTQWTDPEFLAKVCDSPDSIAFDPHRLGHGAPVEQKTDAPGRDNPAAENVFRKLKRMVDGLSRFGNNTPDPKKSTTDDDFESSKFTLTNLAHAMKTAFEKIKRNRVAHDDDVFPDFIDGRDTSEGCLDVNGEKVTSTTPDADNPHHCLKPVST